MKVARTARCDLRCVRFWSRGGIRFWYAGGTQVSGTSGGAGFHPHCAQTRSAAASDCSPSAQQAGW